MNAINSGVRLKRFKVKSDNSVILTVSTVKGDRLDFSVVNASVYGIAVRVDQSHLKLVEEIEEGDILSDANLSWGDFECPLGRLSVVRDYDGDTRIIAFSSIDTKLPLMDSLASYFAEIDRGGSPLDFELGSRKFSIADFSDVEFSHPDLFQRCHLFQVQLRDQRKNSHFQYYTTRCPIGGSRQRFILANSNKRIEAVSFASYDYLGYSDRPELKEGAIKALEKYGLSASGSMILYGRTELHEELENRLARIFHKEDCVLFSSGFSANVATISGILRRNDLIVADIFSHASIQDGIVASKAQYRPFRNNDTGNLRSILEKHRENANGALLVTEGLFSMEGTIPNIREIIKIAHEYNARIFIDECHSIGIFGPNRLGIADRDDVLDEVDIYMGTFSKGLGVGCGGFIVSNKEVTDWLRYFGRAGMFSGTIPPMLIAAALAALDLLQKNSESLVRLRQNIGYFRRGLKTLGIDTTADPDSPIIPIVVKDEKKLGMMNKILLENNIYANCIMFPAVPVGSSRFRFSITAQHSLSDLDLCLFALKQAFEKTGDADQT